VELARLQLDQGGKKTTADKLSARITAADQTPLDAIDVDRALSRGCSTRRGTEQRRGLVGADYSIHAD
jgi:hypothetical protein